MHSSHILLGLVASASAIDIFFHNPNDCSSAATVCTGIDPNICCTGNSVTLAYQGVPTNWHINAQGFSSGGCGSPKWLADLNGQSSFVNLRSAENSNCTESVKPDTLVLADGTTKYDIVELDDVKVEELLAIASSGVGLEGMPKEFQVRRK
ncbi:hypothetical protein MFIFM68171_04761 [Madurella fahalii]|uniref:Uncharacterized protein n=1 Tax=Madurella fahalii TaxID=1157608 RepID=A0ABQ0G9V3_9PEZI